MFGTNMVTGGLSLSRILSGLSRGLTLANQVIPLYQQAKPMISNARKAFSILKEFNNAPATNASNKNNNTQKESTNHVNTNEKKSLTYNGSASTPVFFQ